MKKSRWDMQDVTASVTFKLFNRERVKGYLSLLERLVELEPDATGALHRTKNKLDLIERAIDRDLAKEGKVLTAEMVIKAKAAYQAYVDLNFTVFEKEIRTDFWWLTEGNEVVRQIEKRFEDGKLN